MSTARFSCHLRRGCLRRGCLSRGVSPPGGVCLGVSGMGVSAGEGSAWEVSACRMSGVWLRGCLPWGCLPRGSLSKGCLPGGVTACRMSAQGCLLRRVSTQGGVYPKGCLKRMTNRQVEIHYLAPNLVCGRLKTRLSG